MTLRRSLACLALLCLSGVSAPAQAPAGITAEEWTAYKERFVEGDGRVVDDANGGISHSEGQGYGLLLAVIAGAPADFEAIWTFTRTELLVRDDGLAAWKWDPDASPHVTDINNASDGDILIAYALARAGGEWERPDFTAAAARLAAAIGEHVVVEHEGRPILLPGAAGFGAEAREDGPVVNPSYWVFEAFDTLAPLAPETDWPDLADSGIEIIEAAGIGEDALPPEWISLAGEPHRADDFETRFGYNNMRIPLYLVRAGSERTALARRLSDGTTTDDGDVVIVDPAEGATVETLTDPGYRAIPALVACAIDGDRLPAAVARFAPTNYYPSTLHLLALSYVREELSQCL